MTQRSCARGVGSAATKVSFASRLRRPGLAGLERGSAKPGERVVCVITGHGLKDPDAVG